MKVVYRLQMYDKKQRLHNKEWLESMDEDVFFLFKIDK